MVSHHTPGLEAQAGEQPSPAKAPAWGPSCREPTFLLPGAHLYPKGKELRCQPGRSTGSSPDPEPAEPGGERGEAELSSEPAARACREALGGAPIPGASPRWAGHAPAPASSKGTGTGAATPTVLGGQRLCLSAVESYRSFFFS